MQEMRWVRASWIVMLLATLPLFSQQAGVSSNPQAVVTFTLDFPNSDPDHYSISIRADGHSIYECSARISADSEEKDSYRAEFEVSARGRTQVFDLAQKAQYFTGKIDSGNRKLAFTGKKILSYEDGSRQSSAIYNYSSVAPVEQLTAMFQNMAATLDYGRRLTFYHHYQKLALDEELKRMEKQAQSNELIEIPAIASVLQEIVADTSVLNVTRARAQRVLELGKVEGAALR